MIRQKLRFVILLLVILLSMLSCKGGGSDPLAYRTAPFAAEISGRIVPSLGMEVEFSATVSMGDYTEDGVREMQMLFRAPESLSGLHIHRTADGAVTLSKGNIQCSLPHGSSLEGFIKIAEMLEARCEVIGITSISGRDVGLSQYERLTIIETASYRIFVDPHTSYPVRAESSFGEANITFDIVTHIRQ